MTVVVEPRWKTGNAVDLAASMYQTRDFSAMPILGDALLDAGCDDVRILDHCRNPAPHARGCWLVELLLGKS
jgi:hypothetical protein